jgi:hypothetical protein
LFCIYNRAIVCAARQSCLRPRLRLTSLVGRLAWQRKINWSFLTPILRRYRRTHCDNLNKKSSPRRERLQPRHKGRSNNLAFLGRTLQSPNINLKQPQASAKPLRWIRPTLAVRWNPPLGAQLPGHCPELVPRLCQHRLREKPPLVNKPRTAVGNSAMLRCVRCTPG